jgi:hypothetical protein
MVTDFRLITDPTTLRSSGVGPVSGELWLSVDGVPFPAAGWNDLVLVVLKAWAEALLSLRGTIDTSATVHFMEGPYVVEFSNAPTGLIDLQAGERDHPPTLSAVIPLSTLAGSVAAEGSALLDACRERGLWTSDANALDGLLTALRSSSH